MRFQRECERKKFTGFTKEDIENRDRVHLNIGSKELIERADYVIDNTNLTKEQLKQELKRILKNTKI